jgi:predicted transcriptional regulator
MVERRAHGALETEVLAVMWAADDAMTPAEVLAALDPTLAYTTITTIQMRLIDKGLVERQRRGRVFVYRPILTESELRAKRMQEALTSAKDREAVLSQFVGSLTATEAQTLRRMLDELDATDP